LVLLKLMNEILRRGFENYRTSVSTSLREKLDYIKSEKVEKVEKLTPQPLAVKINLRSGSEKLYHTSPIYCEGFPVNGTDKGQFKWYHINNTSKDGDPKNFHLLLSTNVPIFYPNMEDCIGEIACQWIPDHHSIVSYQPSNFARIGPLMQDPAALHDGQTMIDTNIAIFPIHWVDPSGDSKSKILKVNCKCATITIMEKDEHNEKKKKKRRERNK